MTQATHTPGPRRVTTDFIGVYDSEARRIANLDSDGAPDFGEDETLANAHLIAAAPELLAALEALRGEAEMLRRQYGREGNTEWADRQAWLVEKADAAIAKAKGE